MTGLVARTGNLPEAFTTFVGRRADIAEVRRVLGSARLLTLTGTGGVGKTPSLPALGETPRFGGLA